MNGSFPWKKGTISKGKVFFGKARLPSPSFFSGPIFVFVFFCCFFFKDCKKIARKQGSRKKPTTSEFPPFHVSLSGFLLVKLARVKPRISMIGIDYILRRLGSRETNPQHKKTLLPIIMVRWKMAVWWKVTTYDYWRDIPFLTEPWLWEVSGNIMNWPVLPSWEDHIVRDGPIKRKQSAYDTPICARNCRFKKVSEMDAKSFLIRLRWASPAKAIAKLPKSALELEQQKTHPELTSSSVD